MPRKTTKTTKGDTGRISFYQRVIVLAQSVANRPKTPQEKAEAQQVIEMMKKAA